MALAILDGTQTATTLSTILSSGQHITAHTVVSLGTQAITDMRSAVSGSVVSIPSLPAISGTVTVGALPTIGVYVVEAVQDGNGNTFGNDRDFPISGTVTAGLSNAVSPSLGTPYGSGDPYPVGAKIIPVGGWTSEVDGAHWQALSLTDGGALYVYGQIAPSTNRIGVVTIGAGTVTIGAGTSQIGSVTASISGTVPISISSVTVGNSVTIGSLPALAVGTNRIGVVTIGAGTVTIGAGTSQIGSVTASISGTVPVSGTFFQTTQPVSLTTLPTLAAGTAQIGSVTASISNSVTIASLPAISGTVTANLAISSTAITSGSFTSLTSATLVPANTARKMATVYNLGSGQLFVNAGASATTLGGGFMVALSSGDYFECDFTTTTLSALFATAGTASWVSH